MSEVLIKTIFVLVVMGIAFVILLLVFQKGFTETQKVNETVGETIKHLSGMIEITNVSSICYNSRVGVTNEYYYDILINSIKVKSDSEKDVIPVLSFKGKKAKERKIHLEKGLNEIGSLRYSIVSPIPPTEKLNIKQYILKNAEPDKKIILKNFVIELKDFVKIRPDILGLPNIKEGPCSSFFSIKCKNEERRTQLWLNQEQKSCDEQEDKTTCIKDFRLCDGEIIIKLDRFEDPDNICPAKNPIFIINVMKEPEEWNAGDEMLISFWRAPQPYEPDDCWKRGKDEMDETCFNMLIGVTSITISPDSVCG